MPTTILNPSAGDVHVNRPLTNFSQKWLQDADMFISLRAFPNLPVAKQSDLYYEYNRSDQFRVRTQERADGTESAGLTQRLSTEPYFARVYAVHEDVSDRQRANQDEVIDRDRDAAENVMLDMMMFREQQFQQSFFDANIWFNGGSSTSAGQNVDWTSASADPIADIRSAIDGVHRLTGRRPNKAIAGRTAMSTLLDNDEILSRITGGSTAAQPARVQRQLVAQLFELEEIFVMDSVTNSAVEGATDSYNFIGGDNFLVYYAPTSVGRNTHSAGVQFSWTGLLGNTNNGMRIKRFRMEAREADRIEGQMSFDFKVTAPEMGHFFTSVSS